jgi:Ras-related GTP-binding protein C/D
MSKHIVLMGLARSGKSSIRSVVFQKMSPNETLFLDSSAIRLSRPPITFLDFQIHDHYSYLDSGFLELSGSLIFVIDAQDDYIEALQRLYTLIMHVDKNWHIEVFIHKVDGLSDDHKIGSVAK